MANSPFKVIKTHLWGEVKNYTWGNLTIGQNFKTVSSNVKGTQDTKRKSVKTLLPSLVAGVGIIGRRGFRFITSSTKLISLLLRKNNRDLKSDSVATSSVLNRTSHIVVMAFVKSSLSTLQRNINRLVSCLTSIVNSFSTVFILGIVSFEKAVSTSAIIVANISKGTGKGILGFVKTISTGSRSIAKNIIVYITGSLSTVRNSFLKLITNSSIKTNKIVGSVKLSVVNSVINSNTKVHIGKVINAITHGVAFIQKLIVRNLVSYTLDLPVTLKSFSRVFTSNVKISAERINKSLLNLKSNIITSSSLFFYSFKTTVANVIPYVNRITVIKRSDITLLSGVVTVIHNVTRSKTFTSAVKIVYSVPPIRWIENSVRTWGEIFTYMWYEFDGNSATGVRKLVYRYVKPYTTNVKNISFGRAITKRISLVTNFSSSIARDITKKIFSLALNLPETMKESSKTLQQNISTCSLKILKYLEEIITNVSLAPKKFLLTFKMMSSALDTLSSLLSRFGKTVVKKINTIAVHNLQILLSVIKEGSVKMSTVHKIKQEVIWRMGANARGEALHMVLGETKVIELTVVNEDGTPTDLDGAWARFAIDGAVEKECGITDNKITVMIESDDITNVGTYNYEFRLKDIFNRVDSLIIGKVNVEPKIVSAY